MICCSVSWCVALAHRRSTFCSVHAKRGEKFRLGDEVPAAKVTECDACDGSTECADCDGEGTHACERGNCTDEHECGSCEGTGECQQCGGVSESEDDEALTFEERYLAWAFDIGLKPHPPIFDQPWEAA